MKHSMTFNEFLEAWKTYQAYCENPTSEVNEVPSVPAYRVRRRRGPVPAAKAGRIWTAEEKTELINDYHSGMTLLGMARKYGRSKVAIYTRLFHHRDGLVKGDRDKAVQLMAIDL